MGEILSEREGEKQGQGEEEGKQGREEKMETDREKHLRMK